MGSTVAHDQLFKELCKPEVMRIGWHLAQRDSRDDFVTDPVGHADFAANLDDRLEHVVEQVQTHRYRPRHLLEIDVPKSGLSVRPGNVLPIEEASLLHAIVYLLAPHLDKRLSPQVFSFRLHPDWKARVKKRDTLFRESPIEFPFLKRATIRSFDPFEMWYEAWPDFEVQASQAYTAEGYTHLTKTDITAYFENIDLRLLESQLRSLLKREEEKVLQVLFRILEGWTRVTSTGSPIGRGIPQGNEIGSFLGNLYLVPLDRALTQFCKARDAKWFRYVDDVKVFTKSERDARQAVFVVNDALRALHLNLQGSKTDILSGDRLASELDNSEFEIVEEALKGVRTLVAGRPAHAKQITEQLKPVGALRSRFTTRLPASVTGLDGKQNRLFRRLMTLYGQCKRPHFRGAAFAAIKHLPDMRVLSKSLSYVTQLPYGMHNAVLNDCLAILDSEALPFPYQAAAVIQAIRNLHPSHPNDVAAKVRQYALNSGKREWIVVQRGLEAMATYPYPEKYALTAARQNLQHAHPMVRRAAFLLLVRSPKHEVRKWLRQLIYHADPGVSRLALFFLRYVQDKDYAQRELARFKAGGRSDVAFQRILPMLYALACSEEQDTATALAEFVTSFQSTKCAKLMWHREHLHALTEWATTRSPSVGDGEPTDAPKK